MNLMNPEAQKILLQQLVAGDEMAFAKIYDLYSQRIYGNLLKLVKDPDIAQEFLQDVFLKIWESRNSINPDLSFQSYLFQISRNIVYNYFKREKIGIQVANYLISISSELHTEVEDNLAYKQSKAILDEAINKLPQQRRLIYTLCKIEGKSYNDVSRELNVSTSTISDHIVKATKFIKAQYTLSDGLTAVITIFLLK